MGRSRMFGEENTNLDWNGCGKGGIVEIPVVDNHVGMYKLADGGSMYGRVRTPARDGRGGGLFSPVKVLGNVVIWDRVVGVGRYLEEAVRREGREDGAIGRAKETYMGGGLSRLGRVEGENMMSVKMFEKSKLIESEKKRKVTMAVMAGCTVGREVRF